jgi:DNA-binding ferritin-like protein
VKLYHWKTHSYPAHKATDELYSKLNENIDHFIEVLLGKCGNRISLEHVKHISLKDFNHENQMMREMMDFKSFLVGCDTQLKQMGGMTNSDLLNIRDEMLSNVNQFLYLMTFK